jgi:hypothetical protein
MKLNQPLTLLHGICGQNDNVLDEVSEVRFEDKVEIRNNG